MLPYFLALHGDREKRRRATRTGVAAKDLPGDGWQLIDEMCYRSGYITPRWNSDRARRARRSGEFSYQRSFRSERPHRELILGLVPYGLPEDAVEALPGMMSAMISNPRFTGEVVRELENTEFGVDGLSHIFAVERWAVGTPGGPLNTKLVFGVVDRAVLIVVYGEWGDGVSWADVREVCALYTRRVGTVIGGA
ncbi:MAG: hypothetical protein ACHQFZ_00210 [Acidimicrobiales bacterium]